MITPQIHVRLDAPVTLAMRLNDGPRSRVVPQPDVMPEADTIETERDSFDMDFSSFPLHVQPDCYARTIVAYLSPIPAPLPLYGPEDFSSACGDTMEEYAERVMQIISGEPSVILQCLIDGSDLPALPPRVPREVAHWRIVHILGKLGKLADVSDLIASLPEEQRVIAEDAWNGKSAINRKSPLILLAAPMLGFTPSQMDDLFVAAAAIPA